MTNATVDRLRKEAEALIRELRKTRQVIGGITEEREKLIRENEYLRGLAETLARKVTKLDGQLCTHCRKNAGPK